MSGKVKVILILALLDAFNRGDLTKTEVTEGLAALEAIADPGKSNA
jgi:hypothetical protein